jgi:hypothetical protein
MNAPTALRSLIPKNGRLNRGSRLIDRNCNNLFPISTVFALPPMLNPLIDANPTFTRWS